MNLLVQYAVGKARSSKSGPVQVDRSQSFAWIFCLSSATIHFYATGSSNLKFYLRQHWTFISWFLQFDRRIDCLSVQGKLQHFPSFFIDLLILTIFSLRGKKVWKKKAGRKNVRREGKRKYWFFNHFLSNLSTSCFSFSWKEIITFSPFFSWRELRERERKRKKRKKKKKKKELMKWNKLTRNRNLRSSERNRNGHNSLFSSSLSSSRSVNIFIFPFESERKKEEKKEKEEKERRKRRKKRLFYP